MAHDVSQGEQTWQIVSSHLDVWIQSERSPDEMKLKRPWLTIAVDDHGHIRVAYLSLEAPDSATMGDLVDSIYTFVDNESDDHLPMPKALWVDNGTAFQQTIRERANNISLVRPRFGWPQGRGRVERVFQYLKETPLPDILTLEDLRNFIDGFSD